MNWYTSGAIGKPKARKDVLINYDNISVEHISSQSPKIPDIFTGEDKHKLKNLTILTLKENDDVANKIYADKKGVYLVSAYKLNQYFAKVNNWGLEESGEWENYIKDFACKIFVV